MYNQKAFSLVLLLFLTFSAVPIVCAQGGSGELPGAKPTPTPAPKVGPKSTRPTTGSSTGATTPAAPVTPTLVYNQAAQSRLDYRDSDRAPNGHVYEEFILNAKEEDWLSLQIQSDNPALTVQVLDKDRAEVAIAGNGSPGGYKINSPTGGLPASGQYRVRVSGPVAGKTAVPFSLTVTRLGLLPGVYGERLNDIYRNFRDNDPASVDATLAKLEELARDDSNKSGAFEFLGIIYLYTRKDFAKAENAMQQAIKANGPAVFKISYDGQWRRMARMRNGNFDWEEPRSGWLKILPGRMMLTDPGQKTLASLNGPQVKELSKVVTSANNLVVITAEGVRRPFVFLPATKEEAEADLVIKFIQTYVMGKGK